MFKSPPSHTPMSDKMCQVPYSSRKNPETIDKTGFQESQFLNLFKCLVSLLLKVSKHQHH